MLELVLVRHAKSDWDNPTLIDHERPLNARGEQDAPAMAARLADSGGGPRRILSSTAVRARTTAAAFGAALGTEVELIDELYASSARTLWDTAARSGATSVMLVAHNPGLTTLAEALSDGGIGHMPTCALARFSWDADDWDVAAATDARWELWTPESR